jgi:hypothetical protein
MNVFTFCFFNLNNFISGNTTRTYRQLVRMLELLFNFEKKMRYSCYSFEIGGTCKKYPAPLALDEPVNAS